MNRIALGLICAAGIGFGGALADYGKPWVLLGAPLIFVGIGGICVLVFGDDPAIECPTCGSSKRCFRGTVRHAGPGGYFKCPDRWHGKEG